MIKKRIAIISPNSYEESETFIKAHIDLLEAEVFHFHGGIDNLHKQDSKPLSLFKKGLLRLVGMVLKIPNYDAYNTLKHYIRKYKIECILFEYGTTAGDFIHIMEKIEIPFVASFYGYEINIKSVREKYKAEYKRVFLRAKKICSVSNEMMQKLVDAGCPAEKIFHSACGPNPFFAELQPEFRKNNFFALGRFVNKKSPVELILVIHKLKQKHADVQLVIGGDGPLYEASCRLVSGLSLEENVKLVGRLDKVEYRNYLEKSIAFLQHSVTAMNGDQEGTPVSILEAALSGLPVVSTNHAGIPETVIHEKTGLLVEEHDVEGMANAIEQILVDKSKARQMGSEAREFVSENFSMEKHLNTLLSHLVE